MVKLGNPNTDKTSVPSKFRVCAYFNENEQAIVKALERQAAKENRSLSNLAATILKQAAESFEKEEAEKPQD